MFIGKIIYHLNILNIHFGRMAVLNHVSGKEERMSLWFCAWRGHQGPEGHFFPKSVVILHFLGNVGNLGISYLSALNKKDFGNSCLNFLGVRITGRIFSSAKR